MPSPYCLSVKILDWKWNPIKWDSELWDVLESQEVMGKIEIAKSHINKIKAFLLWESPGTAPLAMDESL